MDFICDQYLGTSMWECRCALKIILLLYSHKWSQFKYLI